MYNTDFTKNSPVKNLLDFLYLYRKAAQDESIFSANTTTFFFKKQTNNAFHTLISEKH